MDLVLSGIHGIKGRVKKLEKTIFAKQMMGDIGMFLMYAIKTRTIAGEDVYGISFKPYHPLYAKERVKSGYKAKPVDLTRTGSMLSAMNEDATPTQVEVNFMNTRDPSGGSNPEKAFFLNEDREFFAISEEETKQIMLIVDKYYQKLMRESASRASFIKRESF